MTLRQLTAAIAVLGCLDGAVAFASDDACKEAFRADVQPILNSRCVACHQDAAPAHGLSLQRTSAPSSLLGVRSRESDLALIAAGFPLQSYVYRKVTGTHLEVGGSGGRMPPAGALAENEIKTIATWIDGCVGH